MNNSTQITKFEPPKGQQLIAGTPERTEYLAKIQNGFRSYPSNFQDHQWKEVQKVLLACSITVGINEVPSAMELQKMCEKLKSHAPDLNMGEIVEAFDLYAFQKLDFKNPHYNSFDLLFLGNIISSYKRFKAKELSKITKVTYEEKKWSKEDSLAYWQTNFFVKYVQFKKDQKFNWTDHEAIAFYRQLEEWGMINLSIEEKKDIQADVIKNLKLRIPELIKNKKAKKTPDGKIDLDKIYVQSQCKIKAFDIYLKECVFNDFDLIKEVTERILNR